MAAPPTERLSVLQPVERFAYWLADLVARRCKWASTFWQATFVSLVAWIAVGRRTVVEGLDALEGVPRDGRVLLVSNHRSFFDFFVVGWLCYWRSDLPKRTFFPVRSTFFYDHPLGILVNALLAGMSMFPPILRDRSRKTFNLFALDRVTAELDRPGTMVGMHPEGTRNKGKDPYLFLKAKPGVGKIALETAEGATVIPVFITGITNAFFTEVAWNFFKRRAHPIHVRFGPPVDLTELRAGPSRPATQRLAAVRCLEAIGTLAETVRAERVALGIEAPRPSPGAPGAPRGAGPPPSPESPAHTDSAPPAEGS